MSAHPPGNLGIALRELHRSERALADDFRAVADRHRVEHEVRHVCLDLAAWSDEHVGELARHAANVGVTLRGHDLGRPVRGLAGPVQRRLSELLGRRPEPGLVLLADLRRLHRTATGVAIDWSLLGQGAHATKNHELLALTQSVSADNQRQVEWSRSILEALAPQILAG